MTALNMIGDFLLAVLGIAAAGVILMMLIVAGGLCACTIKGIWEEFRQ